MDPRIRIRIRIHTKMSWIRNTANIVRKEYEQRAELRRIRGMRVADFLAEHDNPAAHFMATDSPVREAGVSGPLPKRIELDSVLGSRNVLGRIQICGSVPMTYGSKSTALFLLI
jgi:hypothetical protein